MISACCDLCLLFSQLHFSFQQLVMLLGHTFLCCEVLCMFFGHRGQIVSHISTIVFRYVKGDTRCLIWGLQKVHLAKYLSKNASMTGYCWGEIQICIFGWHFVNKDISSNIQRKIFYLGPSFCLKKSRKSSFKKIQKVTRFWQNNN